MALSSSPRSTEEDAEIDVHGRRRRQQRERALEADARAGQIAVLAQRDTQERLCGAGGRIEADALAQRLERLVLRAAVPEREAEVVARVGRSGLQRHGSFEVRERAGQIAVAAEQRAEQRVRLGVIGVEPDRVGELCARRVRIAARQGVLRTLHGGRGRTGGRRGTRRRPACGGLLLLQDLAQRVVSLTQLRIDGQRRLERGGRRREIAALAQRLAELVAHARVLRIGLGDAAQVRQRRRDVAVLAQRHPEVHVRGKVVWFERQRRAEDLDGLAVVAAADQRGAEVRVRASVFRIERDGLAQLGDRAGQVGLLHQRDAEPVVRLGELRSDRHRALEGGERLVRLIAVPVGEAEVDVQRRPVGRLRDRRLDLGDGLRRRRRQLAGRSLRRGLRRTLGRGLRAGLRPHGAAGECEQGAGKQAGAADHLPPSSSRSWRREVAASSSRRVLANASWRSPSSFLPLRDEQQPQLVVGLHRFRAQADRLAQVRFGLGVALRAHLQAAQRLARAGVIGMRLHEALEHRRRVRLLAPDRA